MAKTIAFVNQKGGVGKTTSCVNLGSCLQAVGARVLVCDFDPQGNATSGFGVDKGAVFPTVYDVLISGAPVESAIVHTQYSDVLPANKALAGAEPILSKGIALPFGQAVHNFSALIQAGYIKADGALHAVQIIVQAAAV